MATTDELFMSAQGYDTLSADDIAYLELLQEEQERMHIEAQNKEREYKEEVLTDPFWQALEEHWFDED